MVTPLPRALGLARSTGPVRLAIAIGLMGMSPGWADEPAVHYYSTAAPPADYPGPAPSACSPTEKAGDKSEADTPAAAESPAPLPPPAPQRLAANTPDTAAPKLARPAPAPSVSAEVPVARDTIAEAKAAIASCRATYAKVRDYSCTFFKREQLDGRMSGQNVMQMKARTSPMSVYFKFVKPTAGREAIYVHGSHGGKAVVHDVGIGKLLAGTLKLDPKGEMAMDGCRHPITEAGIGNMIETIATAWDKELHANESVVTMHGNLKVGDRRVFVIESVHPRKNPGFLYHKVKVYIDTELNLPIRFEAYDWPKGNRPAELVEEYIYSNLKLNVGLTSRDFDPANSSYSFGRF